MKIHIAQKGDTLWNIAKKYDTPFEQLEKANPQLSSPGAIYPGMKIRVPTEKPLTPLKNPVEKKEQFTRSDEPPMAPTPPVHETKLNITEQMPPLPTYSPFSKSTFSVPVPPPPVVSVDTDSQPLPKQPTVPMPTPLTTQAGMGDVTKTFQKPQYEKSEMQPVYAPYQSYQPPKAPCGCGGTTPPVQPMPYESYPPYYSPYPHNPYMYQEPPYQWQYFQQSYYPPTPPQYFPTPYYQMPTTQPIAQKTRDYYRDKNNANFGVPPIDEED